MSTPHFETLFRDFRKRLDASLATWLDDKARAVAGFAPDAVELVDALRALVSAGGKRLRPALVYNAHRACRGSDADPVMEVALAVELLHTYLLIHDDIMDRAEVRRGLPASHAAFRRLHRENRWRGSPEAYGDAVAILVGDLGHAYAVESFGGALIRTPRAAALHRVFFAMSEEVVAGQHLEMRVGMSRAAGEAELTRVLRLKSGAYSVERPVELGAVLAGAPDAILASLRSYGTAVGEAFQLQDDILGVFGDLETVGKPVGGDVEQGKFTFLIFHALGAATPGQREVLERTLGRADAGHAEIETVRDIITASGALRTVRAMIERRLETAQEALRTTDLEATGRAFLEGLIESLRERRR